MAETIKDPVTGETFLFYRRGELGLAPPRSRTRLARFDGVHSHHGASAAPVTLAAAQAVWRGYQSWHFAQGWSDIAYQLGYTAFGAIFEGRAPTDSGAHTYGFNSTSNAVVYIGDGRQPVPAVAKRAMAAACRWLESQHGRQGYRRDHRDAGRLSGSGSTCPETHLYGAIAALPSTPARPTEPSPDPLTSEEAVMAAAQTGFCLSFYGDATVWAVGPLDGGRIAKARLGSPAVVALAAAVGYPRIEDLPKPIRDGILTREGVEILRRLPVVDFARLTDQMVP